MFDLNFYKIISEFNKEVNKRKQINSKMYKSRCLLQSGNDKHEVDLMIKQSLEFDEFYKNYRDYMFSYAYYFDL